MPDWTDEERRLRAVMEADPAAVVVVNLRSTKNLIGWAQSV